MNCGIDFCSTKPTSTLTVDKEDGEVLNLYFCKPHTVAINKRMAEQLGANTNYVDLYKGNITYMIGDLQQALDYLDGLAASADL